jgi:hypothetical protein
MVFQIRTDIADAAVSWPTNEANRRRTSKHDRDGHHGARRWFYDFIGYCQTLDGRCPNFSYGKRAGQISQKRARQMSDTWLPSLKTETPQAGFELAVKLARVGVKVTQPSDEVRSQLRAAYEQDTAQLMAASHVIAVHFQTVAAANNYWR